MISSHGLPLLSVTRNLHVPTPLLETCAPLNPYTRTAGALRSNVEGIKCFLSVIMVLVHPLSTQIISVSADKAKRCVLQKHQARDRMHGIPIASRYWKIVAL